jgi:hypothetical protein
MKRIGVELWEEDLWREIIKAAIDGHPDQVPLDHLPGFDRPAASLCRHNSRGAELVSRLQ